MKIFSMIAMLLLVAIALGGCAGTATPGTLEGPYLATQAGEIGVSLTVVGVDAGKVTPTDALLAAQGFKSAESLIQSQVTSLEAGTVVGTPTAAVMNQELLNFNADIATLTNLATPAEIKAGRAAAAKKK